MLESRRARLSAVPAGLAGGWALLSRYPSSPFYPPCPLHALTGLLCPGCGATRALAALAHGKMHEAATQNLLILLLLPALALFALEAARRGSWPKLSTPLLLGIFALTAGFTVWRNLG